MNDPREIVAQLRTAKKATLDAALDRPYDSETATKILVIETVAVRIEPTPTTEDGPVIIDVPDTTSARRVGGGILAGIIHKALRNQNNIRVNWRSDTCAEINWR